MMRKHSGTGKAGVSTLPAWSSHHLPFSTDFGSTCRKF